MSTSRDDPVHRWRHAGVTQPPAPLRGANPAVVAMRPFSLRANLLLTIVAMGLFGMVLTLVSSEIYRGLAVDNQRETVAEQLRVEIARLRDEFDSRARAIANHAQGHAPFLKALRAGATASLVHELDEIYKYANNATGTGVRINRVLLLDAELRLIGVSSLGDPPLANLPCDNVLSAGAASVARARPAQRLCLVNDKPYYVALVPLMITGGGYLYAAGDLMTGLSDIENMLATPLRLRRSDGETIYQSAEWPQPEALPTRALAARALIVSAPKPSTLELTAAKDMSRLNERLDGLRYIILLSAGILALIATVVAFAVLQHTALTPLRALARQLQRLRQDTSALNEPLALRGSAELVELADGVNDLAARLRESRQELERMTFTDVLTDLPNRQLFQDRLQQAILAARREVKPFALLIMDLDRFKDINDTLGHHVGDVLLAQVAQRLRGKLRASDTVARMGGDEFAVMLPAVDAKHAGMAARMLLQSLRAPFTVDDHDLNIGASIGIAMYPDNGVDANVLMQRADVAMYSAKGDGSGFAFYSPAIDQNLPTRLTLLADLRQAVEQEQFELYYQPIVNLATGKVVGIEALARWRHPRDGILLPDRFIPLLEQSGMIHALMPWVISEALKRAHALELAGLPLSVSVNLSMRDLQDPYIADSIGELLEAHDVNPSTLLLEITESAVMTDAPRTLELLNKLSGMGLRIAIDDFGTGYSSLTYLKKLPVSTLKIDKSFITGMMDDDNDAAIVNTSIDLAHNLGLQVVAEGVETDLALKRLKALGCDLAQGHFVGRPLSQPELDEWLVQSTWGLSGADPMTLVQRPLHS